MGPVVVNSPRRDAWNIAAAVAFRTVVPRLPTLTDAERTLLSEWLDRAIEG
ncbi:hypothetical protein OG985_06710 [Streptomyces sp. NBC_00289]|uniref:hypothetical protein n=1 Tax=Streptomyces sp. NBC_00289 TaxID=2975703 RepID=UPI00324813CF